MNFSQKSSKRWSNWLSIALAVWMVLLPVSTWANQDSNLTEDEKQILEIYRLIKTYHVDAPDPDVLIDGLIQSLGDPYTNYMSTDEYNSFVNQINGSYTGVGMAVEMKDDYIVVVNPFEGSPADKAGVQAGDKIIAVNGENVAGKSLEEVVTLIKGPENTNVSLTILRGEEERTFTITRAKIEIPLAKSKVLESGAGYIQISSFGQNVKQEAAKHRQQLENQGITGMIIDLRNNPGGMLGPTLELAETYVAAGKDLLHVMDNSGHMQKYQSDGKQYDKPVVILINENSASASEVFTGALMDNGVAKVVGVPSFGKGVVQKIVPLENGGILKLTVEEYFTPDHTKIHGIGVLPDIIVTDPDEQLAVAEALISGNQQLTLHKDGSIFLNNTKMTSPVPMAIKKDGEWYVSSRSVAALYDGEVGWNEQSRSITLTFGNQSKSYAISDQDTVQIKYDLSYIKLSTIFQNFQHLINDILVK